MKAFKKRAGMAAKYFDIRAEGRKVILTEKKNVRTFNDNRAGTFVMFCSEIIDWGMMMAAYDARRLTEQASTRRRNVTVVSGPGIRTPWRGVISSSSSHRSSWQDPCGTEGEGFGFQILVGGNIGYIEHPERSRVRRLERAL